MSKRTQPVQISRDDIEQRLRSLQGDAKADVMDERQKVVLAAVGTAVVLLLLAFLIGKRAGRKRTTLVEIRRL